MLNEYKESRRQSKRILRFLKVLQRFEPYAIVSLFLSFKTLTQSHMVFFLAVSSHVSVYFAL